MSVWQTRQRRGVVESEGMEARSFRVRAVNVLALTAFYMMLIL